jgi:hypothetical protein
VGELLSVLSTSVHPCHPVQSVSLAAAESEASGFQRRKFSWEFKLTTLRHFMASMSAHDRAIGGGRAVTELGPAYGDVCSFEGSAGGRADTRTLASRTADTFPDTRQHRLATLRGVKTLIIARKAAAKHGALRLARELQSEEQASMTPPITDHQEPHMFVPEMFRNILQRVTCLLVATVMVTANLAIGAMGANYTARGERYTVTITQLA